MDRTHWYGCWKYHPECALVRIEQLEMTLVAIEDLIESSTADDGNILDDILYEINAMKEQEV